MYARTLLTDPQTLSPKNELAPRKTSSHLRFQVDQIIKTNRKARFKTSEIVTQTVMKTLNLARTMKLKESDVRIFQREN